MNVEFMRTVYVFGLGGHGIKSTNVLQIKKTQKVCSKIMRNDNKIVFIVNMGSV